MLTWSGGAHIEPIFSQKGIEAGERVAAEEEIIYTQRV